MALLAEERSRLLVACGCGVEVSLSDRDAAELCDRAGDLFLVAELSVEVEALLDESLGEPRVSLPECEDEAVHEGACA
jgi:hypothetical protein